MINADNPIDFYEVDIYLKTPRIRSTSNSLILRFLERYPSLFQILSNIFGA